MSYKGHILCKRCKLKLPLGKLVWDHDIQDELLSHRGFASSSFTEEQLGKIVLHFLAQHISHDIVVIGDPRLDNRDDIGEYDTYMVLDDDCPWARSHEPAYIGGAKLYAIPCEPAEHRRARQENAKDVSANSDDHSNKSIGN